MNDASQQPSLFTIIGGAAAVAGFVDELYDRLVADPLVRHHFEADRLPSLKRAQRAWFEAALSGAEALPTDLASAHAGLTITDEHVAAVLGHFDAIIRSTQLPLRVQRAIVSLVSRLWYARRF